MIISPKTENFSPLFHSVGCLCKYKGKFLLLRRSRNSSFPLKWGIPTGRIEQHETPKKAIIRELYEETQIVCSSENLDFIDSFQIENNDMNFLYDLFVLELTEERKIFINSREHVEYRWIEFNDFPKYDLVPDVKETVAIGLKRNLNTIQLDLFGHPIESVNKLGVFEQLQEFELSHQLFKESLDFNKKWYVAFGPPGAGKTTALKAIHSMYSTVNVEAINILKNSLNFRKYLYKAFAEKKHRYFFHFQMEVLQLRFWQSYLAHDNSIVDESIFNPLAYTKALFSLKWIDKHVFDSFYMNYRGYQSILVPPVCVLYFYCSTENLLKRIKRRNREIEKFYPTYYVEHLNTAFAETATFLQKKMGITIQYIQTDNETPKQIAEDIWQNTLRDNI